MYQSCNQDLLELYIDNLDKDMWEVDEMVAKRLSGQLKFTFEHFAFNKHTNVRERSGSFELIAQQYKKQQKLLQKQFENTAKSYWQQQAQLQRASNQKKAKKTNDEMQREARNFVTELQHNLESAYKQLGYKKIPPRAVRGTAVSYQFPITTLGPKNIDRFVREQTASRSSGEFRHNGKTAKIVYEPISITVLEEESFNFLNVYVVTNKLPSYTKLKVLESAVYSYRLNTEFEYDVIVVGQKGGVNYTWYSEATPSQKYEVKLEVNPLKKSKTNKKFFSQIAKYIDYSNFLIEDKARSEAYKKAQEVDRKLRMVVFPCSKTERAYE